MSPCLHTMYVDKPMRDHNLMQAIARVNRVFRDKEGGLVVDYIGIAAELKHRATDLHRERGKGQPTLEARKALANSFGINSMSCAGCCMASTTRRFELTP